MSIHNVDLFKGLMAVSEIAKAATRETLDEGTIVYTYKDPADYFYSLIEGRVLLSRGKEAQIDYTVGQEGEIFGWSSMVDRESYTTTAKCLASTKVIRISKRKLNQVFEKHPHDGMVFYKRLADAVLQRLIDTSTTFLAVRNP